MGRVLLFWLSCTAFTVPHVLAVLNFGRRLLVKRRALENLLADQTVLARYMDRFPAKKGLQNVELIANDFFSTYYNRGEYLTALLLNFVTISVALLFVTARTGFPSPLLKANVVHLIQTASWGDGVLWAVIGSYLWNCYDLIRRTTNFDLTPDAFTKMWLKLWIAAAVASILSAGITPGLQPTVGFAIGLISIPVLFEIIADRASKVLNVKTTEGDMNSSIKVLQGATPNVIDVLNDLDIESTVQLAYCDPMNVMMTTNLPWVVIIDLIDQSLLYNYMGPDVAKIRSGGYRGSIEVATIGAHLNGSADQRIVGLRSLKNFSDLLGWPESKSIDLVQTLYADSQVALIWDLFGGSFAERDESQVPDAERVKFVLRADVTSAMQPADGNASAGIAPSAGGEIHERVEQMVSRNDETEISSSTREVSVTQPPTEPADDEKELVGTHS